MCIRLHLHASPCDTRPFLALAVLSPDQPPSSTLTAVRTIDPYAEPLWCTHRAVSPGVNCPWNGCCTLRTVDLPCDCANGADWGREDNEDVTKCNHFVDYHEYQLSERNEGDKNGDGDEGYEDEAWLECGYLNEWMTKDQDIEGFEDKPKLYCEGELWKKEREELVKKGKALLGEVVAREGGGQVKMRVQGEAIRKWEEVRAVMRRLGGMDPQRAEALLGEKV
ncbi:hypothetical protein OQA88_7756 [Cercophora sp. LCS_1]